MSGPARKSHFVKPGYHTGGLLHHDIPNAMRELAHLGYSVVAVSPSAATLHPRRDDFRAQWKRMVQTAASLPLAMVIDLDAPFLHDPYRASGPSLASEIDEEFEAATEWLKSWGELADDALGSARSPVACLTVSVGSVSRTHSESRESQIDFVAHRFRTISDRLAKVRVPIAIRPVSGHSIATVHDWADLRDQLGSDCRFGLAADVGEMILGSEIPIADRMLQAGDDLMVAYLCDREGTSGNSIEKDVPVGSGEVSLTRIVDSLGRAGFAGPGIYRVHDRARDGLQNARLAMADFDGIA